METTPTTAAQKQKFTFAPRERNQDDTRASVTESSRQRRTRQVVLAAVIGAVAMVVVAIVSFNNEEEITVQITADSANINETGTVALEGLSYKGVTGDGKDFIILAETATESMQRPEEVKMVSPRARVDTASGNPITIRSNTGKFMRIANTVNLKGRVVIVRPDLGYTLLTEEAFADLGKGLMKSDSPVRGFSPNGNIRSAGMLIDETSQDVIFTGKSTLVLNQGFRPVE